VASLHGIEMPNGLELADQLFVEGNIFKNSPSQLLQQLPSSCVESSERLKSKREIFEKNGIFPARLIDFTIDSLTAFLDKNLSSELAGNHAATRELVIKYIHCQ
jgi:glutamine synthetase